MRTLMEKINAFEKSACTVRDFNQIFVSAKLEGLDQSLEVEIGDLVDTDSTRFITVGNLIVKHNFTPVKLIEVYEDCGSGRKTDESLTLYRESRVNKWS